MECQFDYILMLMVYKNKRATEAALLNNKIKTLDYFWIIIFLVACWLPAVTV